MSPNLLESSTTSGSTPHSECRCSCLHINRCRYPSDWRRRTISRYIYIIYIHHERWPLTGVEDVYTVRNAGLLLLTHGAYAQRGLLYLVFCLSVCYHVFCNHAQRDNERAIPTGSSLHWVHFKKDDFRITTAFKRYSVKSKLRSQYAN